ncbi:MAG: thioesterase family protein [Bacteroidales bacterium]|nr:thioesterase family protein [Bacteroidales bacterium]
MERIKINLPEEICFETSYVVSIGDINYGGHLANDAVLRIAHEARIQFLEKIGMSELKMGDRGLIMCDAAIQYLSEAFRGDTLLVKMAISNISRMGFDLFYCFIKPENTTVAKIKTAMLFFDYTLRKLSAENGETIDKLLSINK